MTIDVGNIVTLDELQSLLKKQLEFPEFYGMNWSAFWDTITGLVELPECLEFVGWGKLEQRLPEASKKIQQLLNDFNQQYPQWKCNISYQ